MGALTALVFAPPVAAHSPHDVVTSIAPSLDPARPGVVDVVVRGRLMRSDDAGTTWSERHTDADAALVSVVYSPADPATGYGLSVSGEVLRSIDAGETWRTAGSVSTRMRRLVPHPTTAESVFAVGRRVAPSRSVDGGRTWSDLDGVHRRVVDLALSSDGALGVAITSDGRIYRSVDGGGTWHLRTTVEPRGELTVVALVEEGARTTILIGGTEGELLRSDDAADEFAPADRGLPSEHVRTIAAVGDDAGRTTVWLATWTTGAFRSDDLGTTWVDGTDGLTRSDQATSKRKAHWNDVAALPGMPGAVWLGGFDGLFSWTQDGLWEPLETAVGFVVGLDVSPDFADDRTLIVTTYVRGALMSADGGETWSPTNDGLDRSDDETSPVPVWRLHGVRFSAGYAEDDTILTATWRRIARSVDRGASWRLVDAGPSIDDSPLRQFVLEPIARPPGVVFAGTRHGELLRSTNLGAPGSWELVHVVPGRVRSIAASPAYANDGIVLVGTTDQIVRSTDGGRTWEAVWSGPVDDVGVQITTAPTFHLDGRALATTSTGLVRTVDAGRSWTPVALPDDVARRRLAAVAWAPDPGRDVVLVSSPAGLLRSTDGAATFTPVATGLVPAQAVIADYEHPTARPIVFSPTFADDDTVFALAGDRLLTSTDGGIRWRFVELPDHRDVLDQIAHDNRRPRSLFVWALAPIGLGVVAACARPGRASRRAGRRRGDRFVSGTTDRTG